MPPHPPLLDAQVAAPGGPVALYVVEEHDPHLEDGGDAEGAAQGDQQDRLVVAVPQPPGESLVRVAGNLEVVVGDALAEPREEPADHSEHRGLVGREPQGQRPDGLVARGEGLGLDAELLHETPRDVRQRPRLGGIDLGFRPAGRCDLVGDGEGDAGVGGHLRGEVEDRHPVAVHVDILPDHGVGGVPQLHRLPAVVHEQGNGRVVLRQEVWVVSPVFDGVCGDV